MMTVMIAVGKGGHGDRWEDQHGLFDYNIEPFKRLCSVPSCPSHVWGIVSYRTEYSHNLQSVAHSGIHLEGIYVHKDGHLKSCIL
jgi:hypothetical protein